MRMFTEVGRRTHPHATAVGKAMLADASAEEVRSLLARTGMPRYTDRTLLTPDVFLAELDTSRTLGYATDEEEQELGVRCVAVAVPDAPRPMAISMSGPTTRVTEDVVARASSVLRVAAAGLSVELGATALPEHSRQPHVCREARERCPRHRRFRVTRAYPRPRLGEAGRGGLAAAYGLVHCPRDPPALGVGQGDGGGDDRLDVVLGQGRDRADQRAVSDAAAEGAGREVEQPDGAPSARPTAGSG